jgi:hypothetical protein
MMPTVGWEGEGRPATPHNNTYTQQHTHSCKKTLVPVFYMELILNCFEAGTSKPLSMAPHKQQVYSIAKTHVDQF